MRRMAKSSAVKKVARAAGAGGGRVTRPGERNVFFPLAMALVVILGVVFIVIARDERIGSADNSPPRVLDDHFHSAYTVYVCDGEIPPFPNDSIDPTGIHTHGDGLIHIHPWVSTVSGRKATLGAFFAESDLAISDTELTVPAGTLVEGVDDCDGEPAELRVLKWVSTSAQDPLVFDSELADVRFDQANGGQGQLFTIAFVAEDTDNADIPRPDDAALREILRLPPEDQPIDEPEPDPIAPTATTVVPSVSGDAPATTEVTETSEPESNDVPETTEVTETTEAG